MVSKSVLVGAAGVAGLCAVGYCIYFDKKRRSDPDYKRKIRERRNKNKAQQKPSGGSGHSEAHAIPNFTDPQELQAFLFGQIQQGEEYLTAGEMENAADCFCNAITVCDQPQVLLMALQQSTPPQVFAMIRERMPLALQRLKSAVGSAMGPEIMEIPDDNPIQILDDNLE